MPQAKPKESGADTQEPPAGYFENTNGRLGSVYQHKRDKTQVEKADGERQEKAEPKPMPT